MFNKSNSKFKESFKEFKSTGRKLAREDYVCPKCFDKYSSQENFHYKGHCPKCDSVLRPYFKSMKSFGGIKSMSEAILHHGDKPDEKFDPVELEMGIKVEFEHTDEPCLAKQIAKAHLMEDPKYYTLLAEMEKKFQKEGKANIHFMKKGHIVRESVKDDVVSFLKKNPNPSDDEVHAFALYLNVDKEKLEEVIYELASTHVKKHMEGIGTKDMKVLSYGSQKRDKRKESAPICPVHKEPLTSVRDTDYGQLWKCERTGQLYYMGSDGFLYSKEFAKRNKSFLKEMKESGQFGITRKRRPYSSDESTDVNSDVRYKKGYKTHKGQEVPPNSRRREPAGIVKEMGSFAAPGYRRGYRRLETPPPSAARHPDKLKGESLPGKSYSVLPDLPKNKNFAKGNKEFRKAFPGVDGEETDLTGMYHGKRTEAGRKGLVPKKVNVRRKGKVFKQIRWVKPGKGAPKMKGMKKQPITFDKLPKDIQFEIDKIADKRKVHPDEIPALAKRIAIKLRKQKAKPKAEPETKPTEGGKFFVDLKKMLVKDGYSDKEAEKALDWASENATIGRETPSSVYDLIKEHDPLSKGEPKAEPHLAGGTPEQKKKALQMHNQGSTEDEIMEETGYEFVVPEAEPSSKEKDERILNRLDITDKDALEFYSSQSSKDLLNDIDKEFDKMNTNDWATRDTLKNLTQYESELYSGPIMASLDKETADDILRGVKKYYEENKDDRKALIMLYEVLVEGNWKALK